MNGIELLKELSIQKIPVSVLVMTAYPEEQYAIGLINAGVLGYLNKESGTDEILTAVRHVARGEMHFSKNVMALLANQFNSPTSKLLHEQLSKREFQIFLSLASANTVTEIAANLCLSTKTISTYRTRILEKMNMHGNSELSRYAIEHHLLG
jgi:DNA-binding NarL/FixJ family response regulator